MSGGYGSGIPICYANGRYPHSSPEKRAFRSSSGVCEPAFRYAWGERNRFKSKVCISKGKKKWDSKRNPIFLWRCRPDLNRRITVLQTGALPLGYCTTPMFALILYQSFRGLSSAFDDYFEKVLHDLYLPTKKSPPRFFRGRKISVF